MRAMAFGKKSEPKESGNPAREAELARRAQFKNAKDVTPNTKIEKGSTTPGRGYVEPSK